jgi:hypothetical protein
MSNLVDVFVAFRNDEIRGLVIVKMYIDLMLDDERKMIITRQVSDLYEYQYSHTIFKCSNN